MSGKLESLDEIAFLVAKIGLLQCIHKIMSSFMRFIKIEELCQMNTVYYTGFKKSIDKFPNLIATFFIICHSSNRRKHKKCHF